MSEAQGRFLTIEGIEGVGKTTQVAASRSYCPSAAFAHVVTREPGGTPLAEKIRDLVLGSRGEALPDAAELLLMFAARSVHLETFHRAESRRGPVGALRSLHGCDLRVSGCRARPRRRGHRAAWNRWCRAPDAGSDAAARCAGGDWPATRTTAQRNDAGVAHAGQDRFELQRAEFFERVRAAYLARAAAEPERMRGDRCRPNGGGGHGTDHLRAAREIMDFLSADSLPWLREPQQRVREAVSARRLPHALCS